MKTVFTKDGVEVEKGTNKYKGHIFYDEDGGKYKCLGYFPKLDDCVYENLQTGKEVVGCMDGFYFKDPTKKYAKGSTVKVLDTISFSIGEGSKRKTHNLSDFRKAKKMVSENQLNGKVTLKTLENYYVLNKSDFLSCSSISECKEKAFDKFAKGSTIKGNGEKLYNVGDLIKKYPMGEVGRVVELNEVGHTTLKIGYDDYVGIFNLFAKDLLEKGEWEIINEFKVGDLPKDGTEIGFYTTHKAVDKIFKFQIIAPLSLKFNKRDDVFDVYQRGEKVDFISEKDMLNNLNNLNFQIKKYSWNKVENLRGGEKYAKGSTIKANSVVEFTSNGTISVVFGEEEAEIRVEKGDKINAYVDYINKEENYADISGFSLLDILQFNEDGKFVRTLEAQDFGKYIPYSSVSTFKNANNKNGVAMSVDLDLIKIGDKYADGGNTTSGFNYTIGGL